MMNRTPEQLDATLRFFIGIVFATTVMGMVFMALYSLVFVVQPMSGIAPADKQFFFLLSDMSKYILGSLATLLAVKGKEALSSKPPADNTPPPEAKTAEEPQPKKAKP